MCDTANLSLQNYHVPRGRHPHRLTPCATEPNPSTTFPQKSSQWLLNSTSPRKSSTIVRKLTTGSGSCLSHMCGRPRSCHSPPFGQGLSQADRFRNWTCSLLLRGPVCTFYRCQFPIRLHEPRNRDSFVINTLTLLPPYSMVEWSLILNNRFSLWDGGRGRNISRDKPWNNMGTN